MAGPLTDADIQSIDAGKPLPALTDADISAHDSASSDPLGTLTPEEYGKLSSGRQSIRQGWASLKQSHPVLANFLEGAYESLPGGMEMSMPGGIARMAGAAGTAANVASNPKFMKGAGAAVGGALGHATGIPGGGWIGAYAGKEAGESLADWLATRGTSVAKAAEEAPPNGVDAEAWGKLPQNIRDAIKKGAQARAAGQGYTPAPEPAAAPAPAAPANTVPEAQGIDTSALPVRTPTEDQAAKVIPFSKPQADPEVFAAKNRAPRVQKFADYLESNKVPISDLTQLSTEDPFWGQLGKAVGIKAPSKQTVMDTISELLKRQAMQSGGALANNPAAMKAAMALRDAMNQ